MIRMFCVRVAPVREECIVMHVYMIYDANTACHTTMTTKSTKIVN